MKKVLVTGASGFIGRHSLSALKKRGFDVVAVSSQSRDNAGWVQCDLLQSPARLIEHIAPTHLLHFAWEATPGQYWSSLKNLQWLKSSIDLLETFGKNGGKRAVLAGTCAEYDWNLSAFSENSPCVPHSLYGSCKSALHSVLGPLAKQLGFSQAWGRIFYLYGPHEYSQRFVPSVIQGLIRGTKIPCSHGNQVRDFLHVEDVADAFAVLLDSDVEGAVNIGSGMGVSLRQVIDHLTDEIGGKDLIAFGALPAPKNDPPFLVPQVARLNNEVGWKPKFSLEEGLKETVAWWKGRSGAL